MQRQKKDFNLSPNAWSRLLSCLDADAEKAGEKYENIRKKLIKFFQWRGCAHSEEYADRTIDRVAGRLLEGIHLTPNKPYLYFHGVAVNVLKEYWRAPERNTQFTDSIEPFSQIANEADPEGLHLDECMEECLRNLVPESRNLVFQYHQAEEKSKWRRKRLCEELGIPINALRIRVYRIRVQLQDCVEICMSRGRKI